MPHENQAKKHDEILFRSTPTFASLPVQRGTETENLLHRFRVRHAQRQTVRYHTHRQHCAQRAARHPGKYAHLPPLGLSRATSTGVCAHAIFHH